MVSVNTTIYQSNVAIIYILSIFFLENKLTWQKNIGVMFCGVGVVTVLYGAYKEEDENEQTGNSALGIIECILSVCCYAVNAVLFEMTAIKYFDDAQSIRDMILLQGMTGLMGMICLWPVVIILDSIGEESFEIPQTQNDIVLIVLSVVLDLGFYLSFCAAIIFTNPVIASIGTLFALPIGYFVDIIIYDYRVEIAAILGTLAIAVGFILLNVPMFDYCKRSVNA